MKTITTFLTLLLLSLLASTTAEASQLYLRTSNGGYTIATISGQQFFSRHGNINVTDLRPGHHRIVVKQQRQRNGRGGHYHREMNHNNRQRILYRGRIHIPANSTVYARLTRRGHLVIEQVVTHRPRKYRSRRGRGTYDPRNPRDRGRRGREFGETSYQTSLIAEPVWTIV